ncbi:MAG: MurR/RpiR family transcriptional regulator [Desulfococcaceae bacterium]
MVQLEEHPFMRRISEQLGELTPKGRILGHYILDNARKVVFMTTKELAAACGVSEATVVRFVARLGYDGYARFQQALRDLVDSELTLVDRVDFSGLREPGADRFARMVSREMDNLRQLYESVDMEAVERVVTLLAERPAVYAVGSRLSYTLAYYLGWVLTKIRGGVHILRGSDNTAIDWLTIAPEGSLVVLVATSRYPNDLIRVARHIRRIGLTLVVISDSSACPVNSFAHRALIAPTRHVPVFGSPAGMSVLINYLTLELAARNGQDVQKHQEALERAYRENDVLFNLEGLDAGEEGD